MTAVVRLFGAKSAGYKYEIIDGNLERFHALVSTAEVPQQIKWKIA